MRPIPKSLATLALLACTAPLSCLAASSAASSVSDSLTQSSASISNSLTDSSHSSSPDNKQAQGDFQVIDVAEVAGQPGVVELHLMPVATNTKGAEMYLRLPRVAADQGHVDTGAIVTALQRPYGIEFAANQPRAAFFLALADDVVRDMKLTPVTL
ncbi:hypothetical protein [Scleromatobacter humisilvae]|uniref:Uncharacterized protein n=1 Tax=Scleromatobacter humisilvae TaxID=2897159 RepID=A0A9X1YNR7_9BURK|nr:hypothetical protein [Scleromatobacter humisilvae]MCK9684951.1 hypothetical protein [Scleromatobacter humisilvae]